MNSRTQVLLLIGAVVLMATASVIGAWQATDYAKGVVASYRFWSEVHVQTPANVEIQLTFSGKPISCRFSFDDSDHTRSAPKGRIRGLLARGDHDFMAQCGSAGLWMSIHVGPDGKATIGPNGRSAKGLVIDMNPPRSLFPPSGDPGPDPTQGPLPDKPHHQV
jgi:hypothetical protein